MQGGQALQGTAGIQASCGGALRWLARGKGVFRSGPKLVYALYLVGSDATTVAHLFFLMTAVLACTSSYTFACLNVFALPISRMFFGVERFVVLTATNDRSRC